MSHPRRTKPSRTSSMPAIARIGARLAARLVELRLTQQMLADLAGVSRSSIQALEYGNGSIKFASVVDIADALGLQVPRTVVIPRAVAPFALGRETGLAETWIRTCPTEQVPGRFTTRRGWLDPFRLMQDEDPTGDAIASILAQQGVEAKFSGALIAQTDREPLVEGVTGYGDEFMVGRRGPESLPEAVSRDVLATYRQASKELGPVRFEWVHDGRSVWIVQFHRGVSATAGRIIFPGEAGRYHEFDVRGGIEALRTLIDAVKGSEDGIVLVGRVGVTSHFGDLLRRARVPSRIEYPEP